MIDRSVAALGRWATARINLSTFLPVSEITVDRWVALSVIPMLVALGICLWLSWR